MTKKKIMSFILCMIISLSFCRPFVVFASSSNPFGNSYKISDVVASSIGNNNITYTITGSNQDVFGVGFKQGSNLRLVFYGSNSGRASGSDGSVMSFSSSSESFVINGITIRYSIQLSAASGNFTDIVPMSSASNAVDAIKEAINGIYVITPAELGYIMPSYFVNNALMNGVMTNTDTPESVTWEIASTTGYDVTQPGVQIEFKIKDKSVFQRNPNAWGDGAIGTINNFITNFTAFTASHLFPTGSWQKSWLRGDVTKSDNYDQFLGGSYMFEGSARKASFNMLTWYQNHPNNAIGATANDMLSNSKDFYQSVYSNLAGNFTIPYISWDIYARIVAPDGTEGNWLKINKHSAPFTQQGDRQDGGVTKEHVIIDSSGNETLDPNSPVNDPLPTGYTDPSTGENVVTNNNYTYTFNLAPIVGLGFLGDLLDNEEIEHIKEGISWLMMVPILGTIFQILFGGLIPPWAVGTILIGVTVVVAVSLLKIVKGVVPIV